MFVVCFYHLHLLHLFVLLCVCILSCLLLIVFYIKLSFCNILFHFPKVPILLLFKNKIEEPLNDPFKENNLQAVWLTRA